MFNLLFFVFLCSIILGNLACKEVEMMRREAAAVRIQKTARKHQARKKYSKLRISVLALQMSLRSIAARKVYRFKRQSKAATLIEVYPSKILP